MSLGGLISGLGSAAKSLGIKEAAIASAKFVATKVILTTLLVSGLAIVLHNFIIDFVTAYIQASANQMDGGNMDSFVVQLTDLGAYLGQQLQLQASISVILSGLSVGAVRKFIPFMG